MRVHRLEMTAFGPFAETQVVDFEPLNAAGVFLLTGPTGAGKTSVLDAICFALYGQVPGDRDKAKAYRSHHAHEGVPPRIVAEVTLQGRRFRIGRVASWPRRSSRARSGYVEEKARATLEELVAGTWVGRSTRVDEVGHLVSRLLGLTREQFCQVVLLPQGDFAAFLRAGARDRQRILESLFATQRFQAVERWLADHRRELGRACREGEEALGRLVARLQEVTEWSENDRVEELPASLVAHRAAVEQIREAATLADDAAKAARHALDEGHSLAELRARYQAAQQSHAALLALHDLAVAREEAVRLARAAAGLMPVIDLVVGARSRASAASATLRSAMDPCSAWPDLFPHSDDVPTPTVVEAAATALADQLARIEALRSVEQEVGRLATRLDTDEDRRCRLVEQVALLEEQIREDPAALAGLRSQLARAEHATSDRERVEAAVAESQRAVEAAYEVRDRDRALKALRVTRQDAREAASAAAEAWLDARQRYLSGLAAELASSLVPDAPCPVCGSRKHPAPAAPSLEHVTGDDEDALMAAATVARDVVERVDAEILAVEQARALALAQSGGCSRKAALHRHEEVVEAARLVTDAAARRPVLAQQVADLEAATDHRLAHRSNLAADLAGLAERLAEHARRLAEGRLQLVDALGDETGVDQVLTTLVAQSAACRRLLEAVHTHTAAEEAAIFAADRLAAALADSEFTTADEVRAAALTAAEIANADALARTYAADVLAVGRTLADPHLVGAAAQGEPDLTSLTEQAERAALAATAARSAHDAAERALVRLEVLAGDIADQVAALQPVRSAHELADEVAGMCTGSSPDNPTRTALSHYVLGARLAQVVAAANSRLESIAGGRYRLLHTTAREAGDTRGGLGLLVSDLYTDQLRDPVTLSGGETFYVSLSLALGLADVVAHEAGGAELATLFVDEGFGSLDDATRDEVLDELDALRTGGRTVGLVSHLAELRARFPAQIRITATRNGSQCLSTMYREAEWVSDER